MQVAVELPDEVVSQLLPTAMTPSRALFEAIVIDAYREGRLSMHLAQTTLGIETRQQMEDFLRSHHIEEGAYGADELAEDVRTMDALIDKISA